MPTMMGLVQAVRDAIPDLSQPFVDAINEQTTQFIAAFKENPTASGDPLSKLPDDIKTWATEFLTGIKTEIESIVDTGDVSITIPTITPGSVGIVDAEGNAAGVGVTIPILTPTKDEIKNHRECCQYHDCPACGWRKPGRQLHPQLQFPDAQPKGRG